MMILLKSLTWQQTKKIKSVIAVHNTFSLNWIFRSGFCISGKILQNGLTNSRNLIPMMSSYASYPLASLSVCNGYRINVELQRSGRQECICVSITMF